MFFQSYNSDGDVLEQHGHAPIAAVQVVTAPRQSSPALVLQWTAHVLKGALVRQADRHDQYRPRADRPHAWQPPARPRPPRGQLVQASGTRFPESARRHMIWW